MPVTENIHQNIHKRSTQEPNKNGLKAQKVGRGVLNQYTCLPAPWCHSGHPQKLIMLRVYTVKIKKKEFQKKSEGQRRRANLTHQDATGVIGNH